MKVSRREFVIKSGLGSAALTIGGTALGFNAKSYSQIKGANDRIRISVVGVNSRGKVHICAISKCSNISIGYICDVDTIAAEVAAKMAEETTKERPKIQLDFRKLIEDKDLDLVTIATPEHWHAHMTIMAVKAGKNVYVEKPCAHNLREGEMLTELAKKYPKTVIQMGVQSRSGLRNIQGIKDIQDGLIGDIYLAKAWYVNERKTIGIGKKAPIPDWLNWDLWQGPARREDYKDNIVHYNWHWFRKWGIMQFTNLIVAFGLLELITLNKSLLTEVDFISRMIGNFVIHKFLPTNIEMENKLYGKEEAAILSGFMRPPMALSFQGPKEQ